MASNWKRLLRRQYQSLRATHADLYPVALSRGPWTETVFARQCLGADVKVEGWYLAEHFIQECTDWSGLLVRYLHALGQSTEAVPRAWMTFYRTCRSTIQFLAEDFLLEQAILSGTRQAFVIEALLEFGGEQYPETPRSVYHTMVAGHRYYSAFSNSQFAFDLDVSSNEELERRPSGPSWNEVADEARRRNDAIESYWTRSASAVRAATLPYLLEYQKNTLLVSWLSADRMNKGDAPQSALVRALNSNRPSAMSLEQFVSQLPTSSDERSIVSSLLRRLTDAIAEIGYEGVIEALLDESFAGGNDSVLGTNQVNVIPGQGADRCSSVVLAVSKGIKGGLGVDSVLRKLRAHLIRCVDKTRVVIIVSDHWTPTILDEHLEDLRAHAAKGVRFLFSLVGIPDRTVSPINVDLMPSK